MKTYCILDCFVDEPACFGVPPFISPYPRYLYGALVEAGIDESAIRYCTIDALRESDYRLERRYTALSSFGGAVVPGRYLGSKIGTAAEIRRITGRNPGQGFAIGGLISHVLPGAPNVTLVQNDIEQYARGYADGAPSDSRRSARDIARWAVAGATAARLHPRFPHIICEIETSRGCPRERHCSFCSEDLYGPVEFRETEDILAEIDALIAAGVSRFRLGRQADILQYHSDTSTHRHGFPRPATAPIAGLLKELRDRRDRGLIQVLNIDNANPGTIANFPDESSVILADLAATVTPGDTLALGVESFDETVVRTNNLKVDAGGAIHAIEIINATGGARRGGLPALLPGVNLIHGLVGETADTFEINYRRLSEIMERGLLIKRINIRQVLPFPGTPLYGRKTRIPAAAENRFRFYRDRIRSDIEHTMLRKIYPPGTVLRESQVLETRAGYSYGKQIASYAITAKFPLELPVMTFHDALVVAHRERSVIALPFPADINTLPHKALELIPGIGKKRAADIILKRPFRNIDEARGLLKDVSGDIKNGIVVSRKTAP